MIERIAHYRELAAQFRQWAESETVPEARDGLLDMASAIRAIGDRVASERRGGEARGKF
jgi:hypothetical protein